MLCQALQGVRCILPPHLKHRSIIDILQVKLLESAYASSITTHKQFPEYIALCPQLSLGDTSST